MKIFEKNKTIILFILMFLFSCSSNSGRREIDYNYEFEQGKIALSKKKYIKAQNHFNKIAEILGDNTLEKMKKGMIIWHEMTVYEEMMPVYLEYGLK